jgi:hypothetical protein
MKSPQPDSNWQALLKGENVTYWGLIWSAIALVLYLTFSVVEPGTTRPAWYIATTTGIEEISLLVTGGLCWRNWRSHHIPSGRGVWLLFAIATFAFGMGNLWFSLWELLWGLDPAASAGNPWFVLFYLMLIGGVRLAILDRDVQLAPPQWMMVVSVAACGLIIGCWLTTAMARADLMPQALPLVGSLQQEVTLGSHNVDARSQPLRQRELTAPKRQQQIGTRASQTPPGWVLAIDRAMQPLVTTFNLFYILCDLVLLIFAAILFLGFWGGNLGSTWRTIAQAVLCFYIADTWFAYASNQVQGYESGFIMEVFWIFGIVQFGIAAALEFDNSIRARRLDRRRTAIK